jgi:hypothetical protein
MLHIIWSVIVGFVVGLIARAVVPGADHTGFIANHGRWHRRFGGRRIHRRRHQQAGS